jgi:ubiquinone/menaquinone biosynthesis C-methylase UbiE
MTQPAHRCSLCDRSQVPGQPNHAAQRDSTFARQLKPLSRDRSRCSVDAVLGLGPSWLDHTVAIESVLRRSRVEYLDRAADLGRDEKRIVLDEMSLSPGQTVVDVGCGPGTDLARMAELVGDDGLVVGFDADPVMVSQAGARAAGHANIRVHVADAHALPLKDSSVDRVRAERVVQHLSRPSHAFAELHRVLRPGGVLAVADPDWDTLVIDDPDTETSRGYGSFVATRVVRNGGTGRALARLAVEAGLEVRSVIASPVVFTDFGTGDTILQLGSVMRRAVEAGVVDSQAARRWLSRMRGGPFLAAFTFFIVIAQRPVLAVSGSGSH